MPYKSKSQQRKFHAMEAEGKISPKVVKEFDNSTDFSHLPERKGKEMKKKGCKAGNTDYRLVPKKGDNVDNASMLPGVLDALIPEGNREEPTTKFVEVPDTSKSQVVETQVAIGNRVPKGY